MSARSAVATPRSLRDAVELLGDDPEATVVGGGTQLMVSINRGELSPRSLVVVAKVEELRDWRREGDFLCLGAAMTAADLSAGTLPDHVPALAQAARMIGPPQIRYAATLGGNLATAPRGDLVAVLLALDAAVELVAAPARGSGPARNGQTSHDSTRTVAFAELLDADGRLALNRGELISSVWVPILRGRQEFLAVRPAGVAVTVAVDSRSQSVRCSVAAEGLPPLRASLAERWVATRIDWELNRIATGTSLAEFGERVAELVPFGEADWRRAPYRRHVVSVCARRALERVAA